MGTDTLEQLTLFDMEEKDEIVGVTTQQCHTCKKIKSIFSFNTSRIITPQKKEGSPYPVRRKTHEGDVQLFNLCTICRSCDIKGRAGRHARERLYSKPPKDYCCPMCKRNEEQIRNNIILVDKDYNVYQRNLGKSIWQLDHDHETGKVRGLLCARCNTDLGRLEDKNRIEGLYLYLEKTKNIDYRNMLV